MPLTLCQVSGMFPLTHATFISFQTFEDAGGVLLELTWNTILALGQMLLLLILLCSSPHFM